MWVIRGLIHHGQHFTSLHVQYHRRGSFGATLDECRLEFLVSQVLQSKVDTQLQALARLRRLQDIQLFNNMTNFLHRPDVIVYLDVEPEEALMRVKTRSRDCETDLPIEYLRKLKKGYEEWLDDLRGRIPIIHLDWNTFQDTDYIVSKIQEALRTKQTLVI